MHLDHALDDSIVIILGAKYVKLSNLEGLKVHATYIAVFLRDRHHLIIQSHLVIPRHDHITRILSHLGLVPRALLVIGKVFTAHSSLAGLHVLPPHEVIRHQLLASLHHAVLSDSLIFHDGTPLNGALIVLAVDTLAMASAQDT